MKEKKLGTFLGVFVPNVTLMFGVILFLRLGIFVGHAGIYTVLGVIALSLLSMLITSASVASVATTLDVGGGGVYYLITRTLGIELGGALGIVLYLSQIFNIALTVSALAFILNELFPQTNIVIMEIAAVSILAILSMHSAKLALKTQTLILFILILAIGSIFFGSTTGLAPIKDFKPFYSKESLTFWQTFILFFPAISGIEAGMSLSGKLKNPSKSLMIGNALSLIFVASTYALITIYAHINIPNEILISDEFALKDFANPSWLVVVGIILATLSSALSCLLGAPYLLLSMAQDGVAPKLVGKLHGKNQEPRWGLFLTASFASILMLACSIDQILPILTVICLIAYALINLVAALGALMNAPSWRPRFRLSYKISLLGLLLCIFLIFVINPKWGCAGFILIILFYCFMSRRNLQVEFQDFRNSILFFFSRLALYRLSKASEHAYTWHPKILLLSNSIQQNYGTLKLCDALTRHTGILSCAAVVPQNWENHEKISHTQEALEQFFEQENIHCVTKIHVANDKYEGYNHLIQSYGIGPIEPNTVILPTSIDDFNQPGINRILNACQNQAKNLVLIHDPLDSSKEHFLQRKKNTIDIWWNSDARDSFDLLVSLTTTLHDSLQWAKASINLRAVVGAQEAEPPMREYLSTFIAKSRLKMNLVIHVEPEYDDNDFTHLSHHSQNSDLVLIPFKEREEDQKLLTYHKQLKDYLSKTQGSFITMLVCSYDDLQHREIYTYPNAH